MVNVFLQTDLHKNGSGRKLKFRLEGGISPGFLYPILVHGHFADKMGPKLSGVSGYFPGNLDFLPLE